MHYAMIKCIRKHSDTEKNNEKSNKFYLFKFIFSLLVVCIHVNPFADVNRTANLIVSGLLASFAVPYFFVILKAVLYRRDEDEDSNEESALNNSNNRRRGRGFRKEKSYYETRVEKVKIEKSTKLCG